MGSCSTSLCSKNPSKHFRRLINDLLDLDLSYQPDIASITRTYYTSKQQIIHKFPLVFLNEVLNILNEPDSYINMNQINLIKQYTSLQTDCQIHLRNYNNELGKNIIITSMETILCYNSLSNKYLQKDDIWWRKEHFQGRYVFLGQMYNLKYDESIQGNNYLLKFMEFLRRCIQIESKECQQQEQLLYQTLKTEFLQTIPAETPKTFLPQQQQ